MLSPEVQRMLPAVHAISGCDTVSSFFRIGKRTVFKVVEGSQDELNDLTRFAKCGIDRMQEGALEQRYMSSKGKTERLMETLTNLVLLWQRGKMYLSPTCLLVRTAFPSIF